MKHILGFSGGIDSQATARWLRNRYASEDVILINSDTGGNEHPLTTAFLIDYHATQHPIVFVSPEMRDLGKRCRAQREQRGLRDDDPLTFGLLAELKGIFPSRRRQFCTDHLKLSPQVRWIKGNIIESGEQYTRYSGVRRDESSKRKTKGPVEWDDVFGCPLHHPLVDWTKQMCFDYVRAHGEKVNPLYTLGFSCVGCAPCVNSNKGDVLAWATRFPEMIDKVRKWEQQAGVTFFAPCVPGMRINWIDDVVAWSKTAYGGRQPLLPILHERPSCESDYGLCE